MSAIKFGESLSKFMIPITSLHGELLYLDRMVLVIMPRGVSKDRIYGVFI